MKIRRDTMKNKTKKEKVRIAFWIILCLTAVIFFAFIELSKNTLFGWAAAIVIFALYIALEIKVIKKKKFYVRFLAWIGFFIVLGAVNIISAPPFKAIPAVDVKNPEITRVVTVAQGDLTGVYNEDKSVEVYAGIPYAKPPVGELRWKEPQEPDSWEGVMECNEFAPMSMQARNSELMNSLTTIVGYHNYKVSLNDNFKEPVSEDSLYLNIWKPSGNVENAPVLVFIHGGSLMTGQPSFSEYRGEDLAKKGIIVVNFGYRLGVFGYLANEQLASESENGTTGNYGLLDQVQALKWVQQNISSFGGDPSKVTVAGESAGASSVNALCVSPLAKGLFRYAIAESSGITPKQPYHTFRSFDDALKMGSDIMSEMGCSSIEEMRSLDAETLVATKFSNSAMTVDGYAITEQPYLTYEKHENNEEALLNGYNSHEGNVFNMFTKTDKAEYEKFLSDMFGDYSEEVGELYKPEDYPLDYDFLVEQGGDSKGAEDAILGATWFGYSHYKWSEYMADENRPVYFYYFDKDNGSLRANHGGEMPYAYGNLWRHDFCYNESDYELSETMMNYWVNFVSTGDPNGDNVPQWKPYSENRSKVLLLGDTVEMIDEPNMALFKIIDEVQEK